MLFWAHKISALSISTKLFSLRQKMAPKTTHLIVSSFAVLSLVLLPILPCQCADPEPLQDFCVADLKSRLFINGLPCKNPAHVTSDDFFYDGLKQKVTGFDTLDVNLTQADVFAFPGLNTLGMSMNRVDFLPGGLNPPHNHPRATELSLVVEGEILAGWVTTGNVLYWKVLTAGELFVVPPGLVHFQLNVGKGRALFYASFNSQNPGITIMAQALFASKPLIPDQVLSKAFNVNDTIIDLIKSRVAALYNSSN